LAIAAAPAVGHDLTSLRQIDLFDRHHYTEHLRLKRNREMFLNHREEPAALFGFLVSVHKRLLDEASQSTIAWWPRGLSRLRN